MENFIIGFTGAFGSGCSFLADNFLVKNNNYKKYSLSDVLKIKFNEKYNRHYKNRHELQEYGNEIRKVNPYFLTETLLETIKNDINDDKSQNIIVDSFRNPAEIEYIRQRCTNFYLIAVFADKEIRWERVKDTYNNKYDEFSEDEIKDQGNNEPFYGQKVSNCFFLADLILSNNKPISCDSPNNAYNNMKGNIENYINAFKNPKTSHPTISETLMAMAYTNGRRSKCIKRKVGAIIVDKYNNILSSGFNDVPINFNDCTGKYGTCYRERVRSRLKDEFINLYKIDEETADKIIRKTKALEFCRSLHAEENAILNLVRSSSMTDFSDCTLYATTYPCNLCANKIVQIGIKRVVYYEPYPVKEAKDIFIEGDITAIPFEGVTFRAFFKAFNFETN